MHTYAGIRRVKDDDGDDGFVLFRVMTFGFDTRGMWSASQHTFTYYNYHTHKTHAHARRARTY